MRQICSAPLMAVAALPLAGSTWLIRDVEGMEGEEFNSGGAGPAAQGRDVTICAVRGEPLMSTSAEEKEGWV